MAKLERVIYRPDYNPNSPSLEMVFDAGDDKHFAVQAALLEGDNHAVIANRLRMLAEHIEIYAKELSKEESG